MCCIASRLLFEKLVKFFKPIIWREMEGFDDPGIYYSDNFGSEERTNENQLNNQAIKKSFKDFIRQFHEGNFNYKYRY